MVTPILGGRMSEIFSGKWVFGIGVFITSVLTMFTPIVARHSVAALIITRTLSGLTVGSALPSMQTMFGYWFFDSERGLLTSIVHSAVNIGIMFGMAVSGALCESDLFGGWPSVFYITGFIGCIWFIFWTIFVSNSTRPRSSPNVTSDQALNTKKKNGLFSSLSNLPALFVSIIVGIASDALINKNILGRIAVRKICAAATGFGSALGILGVCLAECNIPLSITFLTISKIFNGFIINGYVVGIVELSPEYAGTISGIAFTVSSLSGFLVPMLVGYLTEEEQTLRQWRIIFGITITIMSVGTLLFVLFYTTKNQNWTGAKTERSKVQDKNTTHDSSECVTFM